MVKQPSDATSPILRQIQQTLAERGGIFAGHGQILADHTRRLSGLDQLMQEASSRLGEIRTGMMTTLGFVTHAGNRHHELRREASAA